MATTLVGTSTIGEKGQVVIPIEARKELNIQPNDRLIFFYSKDRKGLFVTKTDAFESIMESIDSNKGK